MKHKHSEIIKAFVDGVECEFEGQFNEWHSIAILDQFDTWDKVRIKPEPQKEQEPQYLYVYRDRSNNISVYHTMMAESYNNWFYMGKVRVEK
jgi:hypothetical protein